MYYVNALLGSPDTDGGKRGEIIGQSRSTGLVNLTTSPSYTQPAQSPQWTSPGVAPPGTDTALVR